MNLGKASKTNLLLAAALVAVSMFAYWYDIKTRVRREESQQAKTKVAVIDESREAESLRIVDAEKKIDIDFRCVSKCKLSDLDSRWNIVAPIKFQADENNVTGFITAITGGHRGETIEVGGPDMEVKLASYGLGKDKRDSRKAVLKLKGDSQPYVFFFGDTAAIGENQYVYVEGPVTAGERRDVVGIIPSYMRSNMQRELGYWRVKRLFDVAESEVTGVKLTNSSGTVELARDGGNWYLAGKTPADDEAVDTFVTGLIFMQATTYVSDDKSKDRAKLKLPLAPQYRLELKAKGDRVFKLDAYETMTQDKQPKLYVMRADRDYIAEIDRTHGDKLKKKPDSFRQTHLVTPAQRAGIDRLELTLGKESLELAREGGSWKLKKGAIDSFDPETVATAIGRLSDARIAEFLGKKPVPAGNPALSTWTVHSAAVPESTKKYVFHGSAEKGDYYVLLPSGELGKLERGSGAAVPSTKAFFQKTAAK